MNNNIKFSVAFLFFTIQAMGQTRPKEYYDLVGKADSLYKAKNYQQSAFTYSAAFQANGGKGVIRDRYNASCAWALANYPDSAFQILYTITSKGNYSSYDHVVNDPDLISLHQDKHWLPLLDLIKQNKEKQEAKMNMVLVKQLDSVYNDDQKYRQIIDSVQTTYGNSSDEVSELWKTIQQKDSVNLSMVTTILDNYGWLGPDVIGERGNLTLFLVIQHADLKVQEKYLPLMREAVKAGKANAGQLALLEDRVALGEGKKQIYGSQIIRDSKTGKNVIAPIEEEGNVDKRRASVGLEPLQNYAKQFGIIYLPHQ